LGTKIRKTSVGLKNKLYRVRRRGERDKVRGKKFRLGKNVMKKEGV